MFKKILPPFIFSALIILSFAYLHSDSNVQIVAGGAGTTVISGGGTGSVIMQNAVPVVSYADITFYDNMDSTTTGRAPTKGSGTWTTTANFVVSNPLVITSTNSNYCNTEAGFRYTRIPQSGNLNYSVGRAGFYLSWDTTNFDDVAIGFINSPDTGAKFRVRKTASASTWEFLYSDVAVSTGGLTSGSTNYIEVAWDINEAHGYCAEIRINGGNYKTVSGCSAGAPTGTNFGYLGDVSGNNAKSILGRVDEVIISSDSQRDLYAIRNLGNYPN